MSGRELLIGLVIAVLLPLLTYYGVGLFQSPPRTQSEVIARTATPPAKADPSREIEDLRRADDAFRAAAKAFSRLLWLVATPISIAAILAGTFLASSAISMGLIFGGIFTAAWAYSGYWEHLDGWARAVSLVAAFALLLFAGYRRFVVIPGQHDSLS
jgi:hypothetical protein